MRDKGHIISEVSYRKSPENMILEDTLTEACKIHICSRVFL